MVSRNYLQQSAERCPGQRSVSNVLISYPKYFLFCHCYVYINVVLYFVTNLFIFIFTLCFISKKDSALSLDEKCCLKTFSKESYLLCYQHGVPTIEGIENKQNLIVSD